MLIHFRFQVFEHHVSILQLFIRCHILGVWNLTIESHNWSERVSFRNQSELAWREVMILALISHLRFLHRSKGFLLEVLN